MDQMDQTDTIWHPTDTRLDTSPIYHIRCTFAHTNSHIFQHPPPLCAASVLQTCCPSVGHSPNGKLHSFLLHDPAQECLFSFVGLGVWPKSTELGRIHPAQATCLCEAHMKVLHRPNSEFLWCQTAAGRPSSFDNCERSLPSTPPCSFWVSCMALFPCANLLHHKLDQQQGPSEEALDLH